jgi:alanine racemase
MLTWAEIDLEAVSYNLRQIRNRVEPNGAKILAVVKDNAYGHGAVEVSRTAADIPVHMLGVATVEEAVELRQVGIELPILLLCCILPEQAGEVVRSGITQTVCDLSICESLSEEANRLGKQAKVHVKIDTGMGRIGVRYDEAAHFVKSVAQFPRLTVEGIFTHFASAGVDTAFTNLQLERFNSVISELDRMGIHVPLKHAANSAAILALPPSYSGSAGIPSLRSRAGLPALPLNMVRPGLMIYGLYPSGSPREIDLKPALSLKTRVVHLKEVPAGWSISYGRTYIAQKPTMVATLAIGYGHGYNTRLSNSGEVLIGGVRVPIIGVICMDQCLCDVTHVPGVSVGDEAVLIGKQGSEEITADDVARKAGTISYEVFCAISARVPRVYGQKA